MAAKKKTSFVAIALFALSAASLPAATVDLPGGARLTVEPTRSASLGGGASSLSYLHFTLESGGLQRSLAGPVHRSTDVAGALRPALARDAVTGRIVLIHGRPVGDSRGLVVREWTGTGFGDGFRVGQGVGRASEPIATFSQSGELLLAWRREHGGVERIRFERLALGASVPEVTASASIDTAVAEDGQASVTRLPDGLAALVADRTGDRAYLFDAAQGELSVMAVDIGLVEELGGGGALPVPVTLAPSSWAEVVAGSGDVDPVASWLVEASTVALLGAEVHYWLEPDVIRGVAFRGDLKVELRELPRELSGHLSELRFVQAIWTELGGPRERSVGARRSRR